MIQFVSFSEFDNIGDLAIFYALSKLLNDNNIEYNLINPQNYKNIKITHNDIILLCGGGWLGIYDTSLVNWYYNIIKNHSKNKIILAPNSFVPINESWKTIKDCKLVIFARDPFSYKLYKKYFINSKIILLDDLVFYLDRLNLNINATNKFGIFARNDFESTKSNINLFNGNYEKRHTNKMIPCSKNLDIIYEVIEKQFLKLSKYEYIITDTLHMSIFSYLIHKPCIYFDNKYHKLTCTWLNYNQNLIQSYDNNKANKIELYNFKDKDIIFDYTPLISELK